ncbi:MAG: NUDIX hydrolase [Candidatus Nanopelagicales bacterium]|nr:NUDIX hydrolase [Candidatus Nanopelagicales bacterium]
MRFGDDALGARLAALLEPGDLNEVVVSSDLVVQAAYMEWRRTTVERTSGERHVRYIVGHPGAVAILAIDAPNEAAVTLQSELLFVRQFRAPVGGLLLEVPAGTLDLHDGVTEDPQLAAERELEEETGLRASAWRHLQSFFTAPGFTSERMELFLALGLSDAGPGARTPDDDEAIEAVRLTIAEAAEAVRRGAIVDAKSLVAIATAERLATP